MIAGVVQALLLAQPCYGFSLPEQVETEHLWLEYDDNISQATAEAAAEVAEQAFVDYVETFDWPEPPPFSILADFSLDSSFGRCITLECDDGSHVPQCQVYEPAFTAGSHLNTTAHEVGHAFQYGITGPFGISLAHWAWWMEGTAEYMAYRLLPVPGTLGVIETYLGNPHWRLHHTFSEFITGTRTGHMYGTAVLAMFIDEYYGGPDTVRELWEWAALQPEDPIFFRDAIEGIGISFDEFWPNYLAHLSVVDLSVGPDLDQIPAHLEINALPGAATPPDIYFPEGLGMAFFRIPADLGQPDTSLVVRILGDDAVRWHGVLAEVDAVTPGGAVVDMVAGQSGDDGVVELVLEGFDGQYDVMVGLSPETIEPNPFAFSIEAELEVAASSDETGDPDGGESSGGEPPVADTDTEGESPAAEGASGGCSVGGSAPSGALLLLFGFAMRRRFSAVRACRRTRPARGLSCARPRRGLRAP